MAKQTWTLKGRILFRPQFSETREEYGDLVALPGVRVQVSAKETKLDPTWGEWCDVHTGAEGRFSFKHEKDKSQRYFRVRVMFKDDSLKLYPPSDGLMSKLTEAVTGVTCVTDFAEDALEIALSQTTRLTYDVDWYTAVKDDDKSEKRGPGVVDFGDLVFQSGGRLDLSNRVARRHADIWWLAKKMMSILESIDCGFPDKQPIALIHPFQSPIVGDGVESSYANPKTGVVHLIENSRSDHFNAPSVAHELMHLLVYQYSKGELGLAWQLLIHGSTHDGRQKKTWVAFHEAVAEFSSNMLYTEIYNRKATIYDDEDERTDTELDNRAVPFSRRFLRDIGVKSLGDLDHYEYGWIAIFTALVSRDLDKLDPDTDDTWAKFSGSRTWYAGSIRTSGSDQPGLVDIINAFKAAPAKGYPNVITTKEMTRVAFLERILKTSAAMTEERRDLINSLLDTSTKQSGPVRKPPQKPKLTQQKRTRRTGRRPAKR